MGMTRNQLFAALGVIRVVNPLADRAYANRERKIWEQDLDSSPHGHPWHTSFHASSFPGDDPVACARKEVYGLMNIPESEPTSRFLRAVGDAGKAIEDEVVGRWHDAGMLLSAAPDADVQTGFKDEENWLTGNCDAIVLPFGWTRPHVVEVKSKFQAAIDEMKAGQRLADPKHRRQCMTYIGLQHENYKPERVLVCEKNWTICSGMCVLCKGSDCLIEIELEPVVDGSVYYVSRDNPSDTFEFFYSYDPAFMEEGREVLATARESFLSGNLPDRPFDKSEDKVVGWSQLPCKWCPLKKHVCKPDYVDKIDTLEDSHAIEVAKQIRPDYSYPNTRGQVLGRWQ